MSRVNTWRTPSRNLALAVVAAAAILPGSSNASAWGDMPVTPTKGSSGDVAASATPAVPTHASGSPLLRDAIFQTRLSIDERSITLEQLFRQTQRATGVELSSQEPELLRSQVFVKFKNCKLASVMDAIAATYQLRWLRDGKNSYRLISGGKSNESYLPKNDHQRDRHQEGMRFLTALDDLPEAKKAALFSQSGINYSELPSSIVEPLQGMIRSLNEEYARSEGHPPLTVSEGMVSFTVKPRNGFNAYWIRVKSPGSHAGWQFNDYPEHRSQIEDGFASAGLHAPKKFELSREKAKELPALRQAVSIRATSVKLPQVLEILHHEYGISFVTEPLRLMPQTADIDLGPMPLGEALDRLTEIYRDTEWEHREGGFLVVRGPKNPARDPKKGPPDVPLKHRKATPR